MASHTSEEGVAIWVPENAYIREQTTVPRAQNLDNWTGEFVPAQYEYTMSNGKRHYSITNQRDFQRFIDGYACPECLAKFKSYSFLCPLCDWRRDLSRDIIEQVPQEWLPSPATVTN